MIQYIVKTHSDNNEMLLHSTMKAEFVSEDIDEAKKAFDTEVETLEKTYTHINELEYDPSDKEMANAIYCELLCFNDEDGEMDVLDTSDYYFE